MANTTAVTTSVDPNDDMEKRAALHGDTSFVLLSATLVFFMTPGLGFFYSGMARAKNSLSLIFISFTTMAVVIIQWTLIGFSLSFSPNGSQFLGDFYYGGGTNLDAKTVVNIPQISSTTYFVYEGMFAAITAALLFGSSAERIRILPCMLFVFIWTTLVYDPICYWTWAKNGWLLNLGSIDFAGGTPVHITSGFAGLAKVLVIGKRKGFGEESKTWQPHNMNNVLMGTAILWFGWFGFNGGSAVAGTSRAAMAALVTSIAACSGGLTWTTLDYIKTGKLSAMGFCSGAVAGMVCITPASGFVAPWSSIVIGVSAGIACNLFCRLKYIIGYDDSLDAFGVHGIGGFLGNILTGVFAQKWVAQLDNTDIPGGWMDGNWMQVPYQLAGATSAAVWAMVVTAIIAVVMQHVPCLKLRVSEEEEILGMDLTQMLESSYCDDENPSENAKLVDDQKLKMTIGSLGLLKKFSLAKAKTVVFPQKFAVANNQSVTYSTNLSTEVELNEKTQNV